MTQWRPFWLNVRGTGGAYTLVYRREDRARALVLSFERWLVAEIRADYHRLVQLGR